MSITQPGTVRTWLPALPAQPLCHSRRRSCQARAPRAEPDSGSNADLIERAVDFLFGKEARADKEPFGCTLLQLKQLRRDCCTLCII